MNTGTDTDTETDIDIENKLKDQFFDCFRYT